MPDDKKTIQPIDAGFDEVAKAMVKTSKEIGSSGNKISILSPKSTAKEISQTQGSLDLGIEMDAEFSFRKTKPHGTLEKVLQLFFKIKCIRSVVFF